MFNSVAYGSYSPLFLGQEGVNLQYEHFAAPSSFYQALDHRPESSMGTPFPGSMNLGHFHAKELLPGPSHVGEGSQDPPHILPVFGRRSSALDDPAVDSIRTGR